MDKQFIYILTNPSLKGWVKVGKAKDVNKRVDSLSKQTSIPTPFECFAQMEVPSKDVFKVEKYLHDTIEEWATRRKEFFKAKPDRILQQFYKLAALNGYKVILPAEPDQNTKSKSSFAKLNLKEGTKLYYIYGDTVVTTADQINQVSYKGKQYAISTFAKEVLGYVAMNGYKIFSLEPGGQTLFDLINKAPNK